MVRLGPWVGVGLLVLLQLLPLAPLFVSSQSVGRDLCVHLAEIAHLARAFRAGDFSFWNPSANLGFVSGYYYQALPQLLPAGAAALLGANVSILVIFKIAMTLPVVLLPASVYRGLRVNGVSAWGALIGAAPVGFVFANSRWGTGVDSLFQTGLYTQTWAMLFYPVALGYSARYLRTGRGLVMPTVLVLLTGMCHPFFGIALAPALAIVPWWGSQRAGYSDNRDPLLSDRTTKRPSPRAPQLGLRRLFVLAGLVALISSYFWIRILLHYDGFGGFPARLPEESGTSIGGLLSLLGQGQLLDFRRPPVITLALLPGLWAAWRGSLLVRYLLALAAVYLTLVALGHWVGRIGSDDLVPAIRFLAPLQLTLAVAAGLGVWVFLRVARTWLDKHPPFRRAGFAMALPAVLGVPAFAVFAFDGMGHARALLREVDPSSPAEREQLEFFVQKLKELPPGRIYTSAEFGTGSFVWMYLPFVYSEKPALVGWAGAALQSSPNFAYLREFDPKRHWDLYNVRYALLRGHARPGASIQGWTHLWPQAEVVASTRDFVLLTLPSPGYFRPVQVVGSVPLDRHDRSEAVKRWLRERQSGDPRMFMVGSWAVPTGPSPTALVIREWETTAGYGADIQVSGQGQAIIALAATSHTRWSLLVNGKQHPVRTLAPHIVGIELPQGNHHLTITTR